MTSSRTWTVPGTVTRVIDGDTLHVELDLGWHIAYATKVRVAGVNCPELNTDPGRAAAQRTRELCPVGVEVTVLSHSLDKYGRVLGSVLLPDQRDLAAVLLAELHAVPYAT